MLQDVPKYLRLSILIFALLALVLILLLPIQERIGFSTGYFLGLFAVIIHLISSAVNKSADENFLKIYFISLFVRFLIVCLIFIFILATTKIHEFSFTVSFIISYIFHSVNEVIFLNHKLTN
jgi:hypothetical protein